METRSQAMGPCNTPGGGGELIEGDKGSVWWYLAYPVTEVERGHVFSLW